MYRGIGDIIWRAISLYSKMFPLAKQSGGSHSGDLRVRWRRGQDAGETTPPPCLIGVVDCAAAAP